MNFLAIVIAVMLCACSAPSQSPSSSPCQPTADAPRRSAIAGTPSQTLVPAGGLARIHVPPNAGVTSVLVSWLAVGPEFLNAAAVVGFEMTPSPPSLPALIGGYRPSAENPVFVDLLPGTDAVTVSNRDATHDIGFMLEWGIDG